MNSTSMNASQYLSPVKLLRVAEKLVPDLAVGVENPGLQYLQLTNLLAQSKTNPQLAQMAWELAYWSWQRRPWSPTMVDILLQLGNQGLGSKSLHTFLKKTQANSKVRAESKDLYKAFAAGSINQVFSLWQNYGQKSDSSLFWLGEAADFMLKNGHKDLAQEIIYSTGNTKLGVFVTYLHCLWCMYYGSLEKAIRAAQKLDADIFPWLRSYLLGESYLRAGDKQMALSFFKHLWQQIPWHTNLTLKLYYLQFSLQSKEKKNSDQSVAILFYTWNNAQRLAQTLDNLQQTALQKSKVFILNNGSNDHTRQVIKNFQDTSGISTELIELPINIGAPAARNWLLYHPSLKNFAWGVFLDDDVLPPFNWLSALLDAADNMADPSVIGCRITDADPPYTVQRADLHLLSSENKDEFNIANTGANDLDIGLYNYKRPSLSAVGCCHLLPLDKARRLDGFDISYTPSQFDDFDLDFRSTLKGNFGFYVGDLAVRHLEGSSLRKADDDAKKGHIQGNMMKLESKYSAQEKEQVLIKNQRVIWDDLLLKTEELLKAR